MKIKKFNINKIGNDYAVGDIHGCFTMLEEKLIEIGFDESKDRLFSVGDLVDRGAESIEAMNWLAKSFFHSVLGNHEQMAISYVDGEAPREWYESNGGSWFIELPKDRQEEIANEFRMLPLAIEVKTETQKIGIIHAECPSGSWVGFKEAMKTSKSENYKEIAIWSRTKIQYNDDSEVEGIDVLIVGHTPLEKPMQLGNVLYIDTGAVFGRALTMVKL